MRLAKQLVKFLQKGRVMKSGVVEKKDEKKADEIVTCSYCDRTLKHSSDAIRSRKSVMCVACYESLLNPFPKCCNGDAVS